MKPLGLKFRLDELSSSARPFEGAFSTDALKADISGFIGGLGFYAESEAVLSGEVYRAAGGEVIVAGRFALTVGYQCVRCLTRRSLEIREEKRYTLLKRAPEPEGEEEIELTEAMLDEPDEYTYEGERVDLAALFREEILLALPMNPSCEESGHAAECQLLSGEEEAEEVVDPRWAPLLEMKKKLNQS